AVRFGFSHCRRRRIEYRVQAYPDHHAGRRLLRLPLPLQMTSETFDYIVVGAGSAGAAVAHRLSADPRNRVLLLEAGAASHPWSFIPVGSARLIKNPAANWLYSSEPEANTNGQRIPA